MVVRLFRPQFTNSDIDNIKDVFDMAWVGLGSYVERFEKKWSLEVNSQFSIATNSGTAALHLALASLQLPKGSKVLVPSMTFAASALSILYNDLTPVFVDCDEETLCVSTDDLKLKISDASALILVHFGGEVCQLEEICSICELSNVHIIEDCAHTQGGTFKGRKLGTWGTLGCFSFEEKKGMTTGDGGMIVTADAKLEEYCKRARWLGINKDTWKRSETNKDTASSDWYYEISELGYKYNMNNLSASLGLSQLGSLEKIRDRKNSIVRHYMSQLSNQNWELLLPHRYLGIEITSYWLFGLRLKKRDQFRQYMKNKGIHTGIHYMPLHFHPLFKKYATQNLETTEKVFERIVSLPLHSSLTNEELMFVCETALDFKD